MSEPQGGVEQDDRSRTRGPLAAVHAVRSALERLASALAAPNLDALVASEEWLADALARIPIADDAPRPLDRAQLREDIERARLALARCRRLGRTLDDITHAGMDAPVPGPGRPYGGWASSRAGATGRALDARV